MKSAEECAQIKDEELVRLVLEDQDYFLYLINRYEGKILRYIRRMTNVRQEEAEDILQDIFIKVYKNINSFNNDFKFSSWIFRIARNEIISNFRKISSRPQLVNDEDNFFLNNLVSELEVTKELDQELLKKDIQYILNNLDNKYREVLILKFLEEKDYNEMSDILKKPVNTIGVLINRAKKKFLEEINNKNIKI